MLPIYKQLQIKLIANDQSPKALNHPKSPQWTLFDSIQILRKWPDMKYFYFLVCMI